MANVRIGPGYYKAIVYHDVDGDSHTIPVKTLVQVREVLGDYIEIGFERNDAVYLIAADQKNKRLWFENKHFPQFRGKVVMMEREDFKRLRS